MSPIALSLDLLLMVMLIAALGVGWRLERRLKGLKESQIDFTNAVADLDRAAQRAELGLAQLRQATEETVDLLASRIEKARELTARLEKLTHEGAAVAQRPAPANDPVHPAAERPMSRPSRAAPPSSPVDAVVAAESLARRLSQDDSLVLRTPAPLPRPAAPSPAPSTAVRPAAPRPAPRPRPMVDDDLFEAPALMAAGGMARRR
jgi:hypothetical protein